MELEGLLKERRDDILRSASKHGARSILAFGSFARQEADNQGDIDFLVETEPGRSPLDPGWLQHELERLPGRHADVVTARGLKPRTRERVLHEALPLQENPGKYPIA